MMQIERTAPATPSIAPRALREVTIALVLGLGLAVLGAFTLASLAGAERAVVAAALSAAIVVPAGALVGLGFRRSGYPHGRLGLCNLVTLLRGAAILALAGLLAVPDALDDLGHALAALAAIVLALDAVDGWAARRAGLASGFGARLDVETDVAFAFVMAALAVALGKVGPWFVLLGLMRPAFLLAGRFWPWVNASLPFSQRRRVVAGVQMGGQVLLLAPFMAPPLSLWLGISIVAVVLGSFLIDIVHLWRRRTPAP